MKRIFLTIAFILFAFKVYAAPGDTLFSNCGAGGCDEAWTGSGTGFVITVETTGCATGECYKLVGSVNGDHYGSGSTSSYATGVSGQTALTVEYKVKFSKAARDLTNGNIKGIRPYFGGGNYIYATIDSHYGYDHYWSVQEAATMTPTAAVTGIHINNPDYCFDIGGGDYSCPIRGEVRFTANEVAGYPADTWRTVRYYIKMPTNATSADGAATLWVDGEKILDLTGVDRTDGASAQDSFSALAFFPSSEAGEAFEHWLDDIVVYEGLVPPSGADVTAPTITGFVIPSTSSSLTVPISTFTATDDTAVTGYCIVEVDNSAGCSWSATPQTEYIFSTQGAKTLYAFARDAAPNVSSSSNDSVTVTLAQVSPGITSSSIGKGLVGSSIGKGWTVGP